ncbi:MAG: sigma-70 family RNA polymerase sigma factor [Chloroflexales bacterium]|nr:sigma-70 family RNA polymerase sigma factor [Chloroflexales bacterium]
MPQYEPDPAATEQLCRQAVTSLCHRWGWRLLDHDVFVERTVEFFCNGVAVNVEKAAMHVYNYALYDACSGNEGDQRREQAYHELWVYVSSVARLRYADVADDAAQRAILRTLETFEQCREAGTFMAFVLQHLRDAARAIRRQDGPPNLSLGPGDDTQSPAEPRIEQQPDAEQKILDSERHSALEQLVVSFLQRHPRAKNQFDALWLKYVENLDEAEISARLGKPVNTIYVLRARAIKKLRKDPAWRELARELGILSDE